MTDKERLTNAYILTPITDPKGLSDYAHMIADITEEEKEGSGSEWRKAAKFFAAEYERKES